MKRVRKNHRNGRNSDVLPEYDFSKGVRGKYAARYRRGTNTILLAPDLADYFPDSESANHALRAFVEVIGKLPKFRKKARRSARSGNK